MTTKENNQRICSVCNSPIKPKGEWDNPGRDPKYPSQWLCKKHYVLITSAMNATYDRAFSEARDRVDREKARKDRVDREKTRRKRSRRYESIDEEDQAKEEKKDELQKW